MKKSSFPPLLVACIVAWSAVPQAAELDRAAAARGWTVLRTRAYLPADLDQEVFDELWTTWEEPARSRAERPAVTRER